MSNSNNNFDYSSFDQDSLLSFTDALSIEYPPTAKSDDNNNFYLTKTAGGVPLTSYYNNGGFSTWTDGTKWADLAQKSDYEWNIGSTDCKSGTIGAINTNVSKLFIFLKRVKKYGDTAKEYIDVATGKVKNLQRMVSKVTRAIAGVLKTITQRIRNWILNKLRKMIDAAINTFFPRLLQTIKDSFIGVILDQIFCVFGKISKALTGLVGDFLYSLIGQVINAPLCAIERWTNALINNLVNKIDNMLAPVFGKITDMLGGGLKIIGSVMGVINKILGFEGFLCGNPKCAEVETFKNSLWGGPDPKHLQDFKEFSFIDPDFVDQAEETVDTQVTNFLGRIGIGGSDAVNPAESPGECYAGSFECGLPQVVLFGGGGTGAVVNAVVNEIGEVIGSNLINGGSGYTSPPFVSIVDPAGCGENSSAYAEIEDGSVIDIVIVNPGDGYGGDYTGGAPVINSFVAAPNPVVVGQVVSMSWDVINADSVSLNVDGYDEMALIGSVNIPIEPDSVFFQPDSDFTTVTYTLTARKINENSEEQITQQDFIVTVLKAGTAPPSTGPNTLPPVIDQFFAEPGAGDTLQNIDLNTTGFTLPGDVITLTWQTTNTTDVSLNVDGYTSLQEDGAVNIVIPPDIEIPDGSNGIFITYALTAVNNNAPESNNTAINTLQVLVKKHPDAEIIPGTTPSDESGTSTDPTTGIVITPGGTPITGDDDVVTTPQPGVTDPSIEITEGIPQTSFDSGNGISVIGGIDIIDTGIGYTTDDDIEIINGGGDGSNNGGEVALETNELGQIVGVKVVDPGYGFTRIPLIRINSQQGVGAEFRTRLNFIPLNQFVEDKKLEMESIDPNKLVRVIDCVGKPLSVNVIS